MNRYNKKFRNKLINFKEFKNDYDVKKFEQKSGAVTKDQKEMKEYIKK